MALYLGGNKTKLYKGDYKVLLKMYSPVPITNGIRLLTSNNYILKDKNGLYLIAKESE